MQLGVVSYIHPKHHGSHPNSETFLVEETFRPGHWRSAVDNAQHQAGHWRSVPVTERSAHPVVRTFWKHARRPQLHLIDSYEGDDGASYATLKTIWIRLIQRRWRTLLQQKRRRIIELSTPAALAFHQRNGSIMPTKLSISSWWRERYDWM